MFSSLKAGSSSNGNASWAQDLLMIGAPLLSLSERVGAQGFGERVEIAIRRRRSLRLLGVFRCGGHARISCLPDQQHALRMGREIARSLAGALVRTCHFWYAITVRRMKRP